ncbi:MAG: signal peptide peptidase SppA [Lewinellaceae bacterium]|nr:signal peptide peptidase SppA [Phaeodactylibacter sp.]MCB9041076.1 signal peptide peptidase SppA [Lewinellaceae bacterium]
MGQFFKFLLASCLGIFVAFFLLLGISGLVISQIARQADKAKEIKPNTVLHLTFDNPIPEQTNNLELDPFDLKNRKIMGLQEMLNTLERAKNDDNIKGIFLEADGLASGGLATSAVVRDALLDFKAGGKFIIAYSKYYSQGAYYLASSADQIMVNPLGMVDFRGFAAQMPFFKDMLDKVGVNMQVYYAGKFKGASEPYRLNKMSDENRMQIREYIDDIYDNFLQDISASRNLSTDRLNQLAIDYTGMDPDASAEAGLVDKVAHREDALEELRTRLGLEENEKIPMASLEEYNQSNPGSKNYRAKNKIAVVFAEGTIVDGKGSPGSIGDEKYTEYIQQIRRDDNIKAIVLRVNSPGGSAMASENIWKELSLAKSEGKQIVVSMGDYAASGGYYISAMADSIFAEPNTLTGSIGVVLAIPDASELLDDKAGIHFDSVKTGPYATGITPFYPLSSGESRLLQKRTDDMYETFLSRVSEGRKMSRDSVNAIAQGRVWTGERALAIGLADRIGGLEDAIASAAAMAELDEYRLTEYPRVKDPIQQLFEQWFGEENVRANAILKSELGEYYPYLRFVQELKDSRGMQARLPLWIPFN